MSFFHLVWSNLGRRKLRTVFTIASIVVAFVVFSFLAAVRLAFSLGVDVTGADRLLTIHKVSLIRALPLAHLNRIRSVDGVVEAQPRTKFS